MTEEHKAALAQGREQGRAVRAYLEALEANKPKRGRKPSPESIAAKRAQVEEELGSATGIRRLELLQLKRDLENVEPQIDMSELEARFVEVAAAYGKRKGIAYATWREFGVPASVLKEAGISRSNS